MASGECRWIGREDVHAYCMGSRVGGTYDPREKRYRIVTEARDYDGQEWMTLEEAAAVVAKEATR